MFNFKGLIKPNPERKPNQMNKILIAYIIGLIVGAGSTLFIVEQLLK
jgi:capsular polysaccharide biosynthesis protein